MHSVRSLIRRSLAIIGIPTYFHTAFDSCLAERRASVTPRVLSLRECFTLLRAGLLMATIYFIFLKKGGGGLRRRHTPIAISN